MDNRKPITRKSFENAPLTDSESVSYIDLELVNEAMKDERNQVLADAPTLDTQNIFKPIDEAKNQEGVSKPSSDKSTKLPTSDTPKEEISVMETIVSDNSNKPEASTVSPVTSVSTDSKASVSSNNNEASPSSLWELLPISKRVLDTLLRVFLVVAIVLFVGIGILLVYKVKTSTLIPQKNKTTVTTEANDSEETDSEETDSKETE